MEILGPWEYNKGKRIDIYLDWYFKDSLVENNHKIEAGLSTNNNGFRTYGYKKVWKGKWKMLMRTGLDEEIDHVFIDIF